MHGGGERYLLTFGDGLRLMLGPSRAMEEGSYSDDLKSRNGQVFQNVYKLLLTKS